MGRGDDGGPVIRGIQHDLCVCLQRQGLHQGTLVGVGSRQLLAVGLCLVGGQRNLRRLAVFEQEQHKALVVPAEDQSRHVFPCLEAQLLGQIIAQLRRLAVVEVRKPGLVALEFVGEHQELRLIGGLSGQQQTVPFLELLLAAHAQGLLGDFFQIALFGDEDGNRVIRRLLLLVLLHNLRKVVDDLGFPGLTVFLGNPLQLLDDDVLQLPGAVQGIPQIGDLLLQLVDGLGLFQDVFLVDVAQLDLRHEVGLDLVDAEADHQVGNHFALQLCLTDDGHSLVDIQQNPFQTPQQVEPIFLLLDLVENPALDAVRPPGNPLLQDLPHAHHPGHSGDEDVKVAGEAVLQRGQPEQLLHQLVRVHAPF